MPLRDDFLTPAGAISGALFKDLGQALSTHTESLPPGTLVGPFRVATFAGRGGMGEVYRCNRVDADFEQQVALKVLRAGPFSRPLHELFRRERQILSRLEHPGIARLIDGGETDTGLSWLALEWVTGVPIDDYCRFRHLRAAAICRLLIPTIEAVAYAHERLVLHGDLKASNLLVDEAGRARLLDFGVASLLDGRDKGRSMGYTPAVASPEQRAGEAVSVRSDIYQLGLLLLHLLEQAQCEGLGSVPAPLRAICARAMRTEPSQRYASAGELVAELRAWLEQKPVKAVGGGFAYAAWLGFRRHWPAVTAVSLALLLLLVSSVVYVRNLDRARATAEHEARRAQQVTAFLTRLLREADPRAASGRGTTVEAVLDRAIKQLADEREPGLQLELNALLGEILMVREDAARARPLLREAVRLADQQAAPIERRAKLRRHLAMAITGSRETDEARQLVLESLQLLNQLEQPGRERADALRNLALIEYYAGKLPRAIELQEQALEFATKIYGDESPELTIHLQNLGQYYGVAGDVSRGIPILERGYLISLDTVGPRHPQTINLGGALVQSLSFQGAHERAAGLHEQLHAATVDLWGAGSPNDALMWMSKADLEARRENCQGALGIYRQALELWQALPSENDLNSVGTLQGLGDCLMKLGRLEEALAVFTQMVERNQDGKHASDLDLGHRHLRLAEALIALNRCPEAVLHLRSARTRQQQAAPERAELATAIDNAAQRCAEAPALTGPEPTPER